VEKICDFFVGIVVFLGIKVVMTPPAVSIPSESGATSKRMTSDTFLSWTPLKIAA
jgi:hypothetical protein